MSTVTIWTDGGCWPNPGPGGWAAIIRLDDLEAILTGRHPQTTNNRMELTAAIEAIGWLSEPSDVTLITDSQYLQKGAALWSVKWHKRGWREKKDGDPIKNADLWQEIWRLCSMHRVTWKWVRGHADCVENNKCDELAMKAMQDLSQSHLSDLVLNYDASK